MFSFSTLSVLATLACAVFTSAVPLDPKVPGSLPPVVVADYLTGKHGNRAGPADILTGHLGGVVPRHEGHHDGSGSGSGLLGGLVGSRHEDHDHRSLPMILLDVSAQVGPLCDKLQGLVTARATVEVTTPIFDELKVIVGKAIIEVRALHEHPTEFVLSLHGRVLSVYEVAQLCAFLFSTIYVSLGVVLRVVAVAQFRVIFPLLVDVGIVVGNLMVTVLINVDGLLVVLIPLIECIIPTVLQLNIVSLILVLGL